MTTALDIINGALSRLNADAANSEPTDEDIEITKNTLNTLIDSLSNVQQNIFSYVNPRFQLVGNKQSYTLGPANDPDTGLPTGADWVIERPMRIEKAILMPYAPIIDPGPPIVIGENSGTLFLELDILNFYQFSELTVRYLQTTWPTCVYDNGGYPLRTLSFFPVPESTLAVELWLWEPLTDYTSLTQPLDLPPGYERYLITKLALEVAPAMGANVTETLRAQARESEDNIRILNQITTTSEASVAARGLSRRLPDYLRNNGRYTRVPRVW